MRPIIPAGALFEPIETEADIRVAFLEDRVRELEIAQDRVAFLEDRVRELEIAHRDHELRFKEVEARLPLSTP